eukprot:2396864-Heterocapsa_arctica.AAC.1
MPRLGGLLLRCPSPAVIARRLALALRSRPAEARCPASCASPFTRGVADDGGAAWCKLAGCSACSNGRR